MLKGATIHFLSIWSRILFKHLYALLDPRRWTKGSYELGSVRLSILPSENFLGIGSLVFSETHHGVRDPCGVRNRAAFFEKKNLTPKWGKWSKFCPDNGFLNFLENLVIFFFWIWSITKVYSICCKMFSANQIVRFLQQTDVKAWFFACWYRLTEIKVDWKKLGFAWSKIAELLLSQKSKIGCISRSN